MSPTMSAESKSKISTTPVKYPELWTDWKPNKEGNLSRELADGMCVEVAYGSDDDNAGIVFGGQYHAFVVEGRLNHAWFNWLSETGANNWANIQAKEHGGWKESSNSSTTTI